MRISELYGLTVAGDDGAPIGEVRDVRLRLSGGSRGGPRILADGEGHSALPVCAGEGGAGVGWTRHPNQWIRRGPSAAQRKGVLVSESEALIAGWTLLAALLAIIVFLIARRRE